MKNKLMSFLSKSLSYILVAALASWVTMNACANVGLVSGGKLQQLEQLIHERFIGESDSTQMQDAAAAAMVDSLGDRWSYYIPADQYASYKAQMENQYVGVGITIEFNEEKGGYEIQQVEPSGGARAAGIQPGDVLTHVEGKSVLEMTLGETGNMVKGDVGTEVSLTVLRGEEEKTFSVTRQVIQVTVASGQMLEGNVGYVKIDNFDARCADETIAAMEKLLEEGATALLFDVRFNPGGYKEELVKILDYILPEGELFHSVDYAGKEQVDTSAANCLKMPMAVLINADSYSAAEFFAAALEEYNWAVTVGEATQGKGYFQNTFQLDDGSAVGLSVGKYFTPNGVSLAETGGLEPEISVKVDDETAARIYANLLDPMEDPQVLAALEALSQHA